MKKIAFLLLPLKPVIGSLSYFGQTGETFINNYLELHIYIYLSRKKLALGQCHFLTPMYCNRLFRRHFSPLSLTIFDACHGYWIPASTLSNALVQMHNLEELIIHDTKLSLAHLLGIFKTCKKIVKLSFSLLEANLDAHQKDGDSFSLGFGRITHLKYTVNQSELYSIDSWPVTLGVLW